MTQLKRRSVEFSLDNFGAGYSSLSYLQRLPLDELKIERSFVRDVTTDIRDAAIARVILSLGQTMGLTVIAEGVETAEQRGFLLRLGCTAHQGYLFGRPGPVEDLWLSQHGNRQSLPIPPASVASFFPEQERGDGAHVLSMEEWPEAKPRIACCHLSG